MDFNKNFYCTKCNISYDSSTHTPLKLPNCNHSICSKCISEQIIKNNNSIICPIDKIISKNINSVEEFKINKKLIEDINNYKFKTKNSKILITDLEDLSIGNEITSKNEFLKNDILDINQANTSLSSTFFNLKLKNENISICPFHSMPNNIICINDRIKICIICSKNNMHINHQILTEDELLKQIEKLIDTYQEIEKKNLDFNKNIKDISKKDINKMIELKIENLKELVNLTKNDIINNINIQIEQIIYYLDFRKNELKNKYSSLIDEIKKLKEDVLYWKKLTTNKLDKLNEINNISSECLKLLDSEPNKNVINLFKKGILLNEKYNNIKENINNLIKFCEDGININSNNDLIEKIKFIYTKKKNNYQKLNNSIDSNKKIINNYKVNTKLFKINENNKLIKDLNLSLFIFDDDIRNSLNKSLDNKIENELKDKKGNNIEIKDNINPIITLKQNYNNNIYNNYNSYNYNYQNNISPNLNYNLNINCNSPTIKTNSNKKNDNSILKDENYEKIHFYKILPKNNKKSSINDKKIQEKKFISTFNDEPLNKNKKITISARNKKKTNKSKKESDSINRENSIKKINNNYTSNCINNLSEINNSKLSKIINPIENTSFQDSINNVSSVYYLSSLFDRNNNSTEISKTKEKLENENSILNFSNTNNNITEKELKINSKDIEINNLIINQLKNESPNFNGHNINGKGIEIFCNLLKKKQKIKFNEILMEHCELNDDDISLLMKTLIEKNVEFEMLDLSWNKITDQSGLFILELIKENKTLNILLLNNNLFSDSLKEKLESYVNLGRIGLENIKLYI